MTQAQRSRNPKGSLSFSTRSLLLSLRCSSLYRLALFAVSFVDILQTCGVVALVWHMHTFKWDDETSLNESWLFKSFHKVESTGSAAYGPYIGLKNFCCSVEDFCSYNLQNSTCHQLVCSIIVVLAAWRVSFLKIKPTVWLLQCPGRFRAHSRWHC